LPRANEHVFSIVLLLTTTQLDTANIQVQTTHISTLHHLVPAPSLPSADNDTQPSHPLHDLIHIASTGKTEASSLTPCASGATARQIKSHSQHLHECISNRRDNMTHNQPPPLPLEALPIKYSPPPQLHQQSKDTLTHHHPPPPPLEPPPAPFPEPSAPTSGTTISVPVATILSPALATSTCRDARGKGGFLNRHPSITRGVPTSMPPLL